MSNDIIHKCAICEADFRPGALDKNGKCPICRVEYPTVKNKKEAMALNRPEINLGEKVDVEKVKQIVKEAINELKAELKADAKIDNMAKARAARQDKKDSKEETE
jgi:predicted  nucleic acid-binding Zn-ribbon protein